MRAIKSNSEPTRRLSISDLWPRLHWKVSAPAIRILLTLPVLCTLILISAHPAQAQTETVLYNFCSVESYGNCLDGANPLSSLTSDGGNWYGTTSLAGWDMRDQDMEPYFSSRRTAAVAGTNPYSTTSAPRVGGTARTARIPTALWYSTPLGNLYGTTPRAAAVIAAAAASCSNLVPREQVGRKPCSTRFARKALLAPRRLSGRLIHRQRRQPLRLR